MAPLKEAALTQREVITAILEYLQRTGRITETTVHDVTLTMIQGAAVAIFSYHEGPQDSAADALPPQSHHPDQ